MKDQSVKDRYYNKYNEMLELAEEIDESVAHKFLIQYILAYDRNVNDFEEGFDLGMAYFELREYLKQFYSMDEY